MGVGEALEKTDKRLQVEQSQTPDLTGASIATGLFKRPDDEPIHVPETLTKEEFAELVTKHQRLIPPTVLANQILEQLEIVSSLITSFDKNFHLASLHQTILEVTARITGQMLVDLKIYDRTLQDISEATQKESTKDRAYLAWNIFWAGKDSVYGKFEADIRKFSEAILVLRAENSSLEEKKNAISAQLEILEKQAEFVVSNAEKEGEVKGEAIKNSLVAEGLKEKATMISGAQDFLGRFEETVKELKYEITNRQKELERLDLEIVQRKEGLDKVKTDTGETIEELEKELNTLLLKPCGDSIGELKARISQIEAIQKEAEKTEIKLRVAKRELDPSESGRGKIVDLCNLKVTNTALGRQVTFTIPAGMSGIEMLRQIEKNNPREGDDGVVWKKSALWNDPGLKTVHKEAMTYTFTVLVGTVDMTRSQQEGYAAEKDMKLTERWIITIGAALFRDMQGFPNNRSDIGTLKDKGDVFNSLWIRALSGDLKSYDLGLDGHDWYGGTVGSRVAAAASPESKKS